MKQGMYLGRRKFVALGAAAAGTMLFGLGGCTPTAQTGAADAAPSYQAGTYTAAATGKKGPVNIAVTFSDDAIETIEILTTTRRRVYPSVPSPTSPSRFSSTRACRSRPSRAPPWPPWPFSTA